MVAEQNIVYALETGVKNALIINDREEDASGTIHFSAKDGIVTVTGTAGSNTCFFSQNFTGLSGRFKLNGCPIGGSDNTYLQRIYTSDGSIAKGIDRGSGTAEFTLDPNVTYQWTIRIQGNYAIQNSLVFRPMMYQADTDGSTFQTGALPNYELTQLEAEDRAGLIECVDGGAKNIIAPSEVTYPFRGMTLTYSADGILVTGTATDGTTQNPYTYVHTGRITIKAGLTYAVYDAAYTDTTTAYFYVDSSTAFNIQSPAITNVVQYLIAQNSGTFNIYMRVPYNATVNKLYKPMICTKAAFGVSSKFVPYRPNWDLVAKAVDASNLYGEFAASTSITFESSLALVTLKRNDSSGDNVAVYVIANLRDGLTYKSIISSENMPVTIARDSNNSKNVKITNNGSAYYFYLISRYPSANL